MEKKRCAWSTSDALYIKYHDEEWGAPSYDDDYLFEMICLEGQQAGLSWITILKKRENYRRLFAGFNAESIANFSDDYLEQILLDKGIIRNRLKVFAIRKNAIAFLKIQKEQGSFSSYIWSFVGGKPITNNFESMGDLPAKTSLSIQMSKQLKKYGFTFVGPTICYAFMQASGMVNDHTKDCYKYHQ
ncbi:MAG: DNA-3-methyladenine glycosylase I [Chitinophagales bacterium]|jgi:DNA-3-methyladenine glycosylase I